MDKFLDTLVSELRPVRPRRPATEVLVIAALCAAELTLWLALGHAQPHLLQVARATPTFWWKLTSFAALAAVGAVTAIFSFDPTVSPRRGLMGILAILAGYLLLGVVLDDHVGKLDLVQRLDIGDGVECLENVVLLSAPIVAALGWLMRRGATSHAEGTALACGAAAAAWGAFVWTFTCPHQDPLYVMVWYTLAWGISAGIARLVLPRLGRW
jgi:hypothetical protein